MGSLRPTFRPTRAAWYRRPGGPWDAGSLDAALSAGGGAVVDGSLRLTPGQMLERVAAVAGALRQSGVRRGDVVAWQLPNGWEPHALYRACWRLGAIAAPVHHAAGSEDRARALSQVSPRVVVSSVSSLPSGPPVSLAASAGRPSDLAVVLFTAGSTGQPKAVLHTQRGLLAKARTMAGAHALCRDDVVLMPAPAAHVSGLLNGVLVPGVAGMRTVWMPRWEPSAAIGVVEAEQVTFMIGPPTFFVTLMQAPGFSPARAASLRLISSGGAGVTPSFVDEATGAFGALVKRTYGSTEAPTITTSSAGDPPDRARSTDGRATGEAEVRVVETASGRDQPSGATGEVWVRGPELFVGYTAVPATREAFVRGGWFRTGDLGQLDGGGWLTIVGRIKDVIIRGGENISAAEIEAHLEAHPAVQQAAAVGYPDDRLGERVCAVVVASERFDLADCRTWFESRGVTRFKWPEQVVQLRSMPVLGAGKIDRAALRARAAQ
jgi:acyl-CoA synthetase (AMP-forming)/AMP-acid ligase II